MNTNSKWIYWAIIAVLIGLLIVQHSCEGDGETKTTVTTRDVDVVIPGSGGVIEKPTSETELPSAGKDSIIYMDKIIYVASKADTVVVNKYINAPTDNDKMAVLLDATRERDYVSEFEDDKIKIKIDSKVNGILKSTKPTYFIKPQTVTVQETTITHEKTLSSKFALFAGVHAQTNTSLGKIAPGADLSAQINGKTIITAGINTEKDVTVGVKLRIFNINK